MKLLLTSNGLSNDSIAQALFSLTQKKPEETTVVFIPTASNVEQGDKSWLINDLLNLKKQNFKSIEIVDISAVDETIWKSSFDRADVLFFEGGNTYHLMNWMHKSGLTNLLPELLKNKVYVGVSAGSIVTNPDLDMKLSSVIYDDAGQESTELSALNFVDFYFLPHLNSEWFPRMRNDIIKEFASSIKRKIYALDDDSALKIIDGDIEVISEGDWLLYNDL